MGGYVVGGTLGHSRLHLHLLEQVVQLQQQDPRAAPRWVLPPPSQQYQRDLPWWGETLVVLCH